MWNGNLDECIILDVIVGVVGTSMIIIAGLIL